METTNILTRIKFETKKEQDRAFFEMTSNQKGPWNQVSDNEIMVTLEQRNYLEFKQIEFITIKKM